MSKWTPRTHSYRMLCIRVKREEPVCWLCGEPINPQLRHPDPRSYSTDHIKSPKTHPALAEVRSNVRASHLVCNQKRKMDKSKARPPKPGLEITVTEF